MSERPPFLYAILLISFCSLCVMSPSAQSRRPAPGDAGYVAEDPELARLIGTPGPSLSLKTLDGHTIDLANSYGQKPIYLKLWATYCLPCRAQMPEFERIYERFGDRMQIVSVNAGVGDDADKVRAFLKKQKSRIPTVMDDGSLGAWLKMEGTPFHLLIGRDGKIAYAGHQDGPRLDAAIQQVLDEHAPTASTASTASTAPIATAKVETIAVLKPGDRVPAIDVRRPDDTPMRLDAGTTGKPRAVLFMSVWCETYLKPTEPESVEACRRVREQVDTLSQSGNGSVEWLGIATHLWTTPADLAKYQTRVKPRVPLAVDTDGRAFRVFGIQRLPAVALIDTNGRLVRIIGPDDRGNLASAVEQLAARK